MSNINKLVLHPTDRNYRPRSWESVQQALLEAQVIGASIGQSAQAFEAGDRLLQWVTFMGCSPSLAFTPPVTGSSDYCHIVFSNLISSQLQFRCHSQSLMARCPGCGRRVNDGVANLQNYLEGHTDTQFHCLACGKQGAPEELNWRHRGGLARVFIDIYSVYPQEAVPTDQLLALLQRASDVQWSYFYTDQ